MSGDIRVWWKLSGWKFSFVQRQIFLALLSMMLMSCEKEGCFVRDYTLNSSEKKDTDTKISSV